MTDYIERWAAAFNSELLDDGIGIFLQVGNI
jgi:hypothetical protein